MNYVNLLAMNSVESVSTGLSGAIGSKLLFGTRYIDFNLPVLNMLNGYDSMILYGLIFGGANALSNVTGDFVLPLVSGSNVYSYLNKLTKPISIGLLSVLLMFALNNFYISLMGGLQGFALGATSNIVGQWASNMVFKNSNPLLSMSNNTNPQVSIPVVEPPPQVNNYSSGYSNGYGLPFDNFMAFNGFF